MVVKALHAVIEELAPRIGELAQRSDQTPEEFLYDVIEEKRKELARKKLDEVVADAVASGFREVKDPVADLEYLKSEARRRYCTK